MQRALATQTRSLLRLTRPASSSAPQRVAGGTEVAARPKGELQYDEPTHTGQAWDQDDYRNVRFTRTPRVVNPNFAANLIADVPPQECTDRVVFCDGGDEALGHPRVYINLDKPGNHICGYCGLRFHLKGQGGVGQKDNIGV